MTENKALQSVYTSSQAQSYTTELIEKRKAEQALVLRSGISTMDKFVQPWLPGEQIIILAQTSHGKTAMLQAMARNIVQQLERREDNKQVVVYASWETLVEELAVYDLAQATGISGTSLWYGSYDVLDGTGIREAAMKLSARPMWYIGHSLKRRRAGGGMTVKALSEALRVMESEYGVTPAAVFVDYIQIVTPEPGLRDKRIEVMHNIDALRDLGRDSGAPVVIGCQAGRHVSERVDKLPEIGDGMESARLEQDADKVLALWYPCKTQDNNTITPAPYNIRVTPNLLLVGVRKQRRAESGQRFPLWFEPAHNAFSAWREEQAAPVEREEESYPF
jgi:replicative DNA helicase